MQRKFIQLKNVDYISADINNPVAMIKFDIQFMSLLDNTFDCIICYHVMSEVPDDRKAMSELFRVLKPGGWAIIQSGVDHNLDKTIEDPNVKSPEERARLFRGPTNVRTYGRDYKHRLENAGFNVKLDNYVRDLSADIIQRHGLDKDEIIYLCKKPHGTECTDREVAT